jgi:hypothetical protein
MIEGPSMLEAQTLLLFVSGAVGATVLFAILVILHRHAIYLYGHRVSSFGGRSSYRFALQNGERSSLEGRFRVELRCSPGATFAEKPQVFAGPRLLSGDYRPEVGRYTLDFSRLPPYDTWVFLCDVRRIDEPSEGHGETKGDAAGKVAPMSIQLKISELDLEGNPKNRVLPRLSASELEMSPTRTLYVVGSGGKPPVLMGVMTAALACLAYGVTVIGWMGIARTEFQPGYVDIVCLAAIASMAYAFFRVAAPPEPRAVQGYLEESHVSFGGVKRVTTDRVPSGP